MINRKFLVAGVVGLVAAGGGFIAATTSGSPSHASTPASGTEAAAPGSATVNVATDTVNGKSEQILVTSNGSPLYTFSGDSANVSAVSGQLAALWPPLTSAAPTESGTNGTLTVVHDSNGPQVRYDGRFLYTFVADGPGRVTGQGVQGFSVATPSATTAPAVMSNPAPSTSHSFGY